MQSKEQMNGLRPYEEIEQLTQEIVQVKQDDPMNHYKMIEKIGEGAFGSVYKCKRLEDGYITVAKLTSSYMDEK